MNSTNQHIIPKATARQNYSPQYQYDNHLGSASLELDHNANIISYEEYHPFGTTSYRSGRTETEVSLKRYKYVGKERDEETGLYYYGARYYAAWVARFVSVDPLAHEREWLSTYNAFSNNPINRIDPDGALDNPIYDCEGNFLGTDDKGLQGEAIIMNKEDFTQGMAYDDTLSKGTLFSDLGSLDRWNFTDKGWEHWKTLDQRPDWDGVVTIKEGIAWLKVIQTLEQILMM